MNWNMRGFETTETGLVEELLHETDALCLTETWGRFVASDHWISHECFKSGDIRQFGPRCGGVALIVAHNTKFRFRLEKNEHYQFILGTLWFKPIMASYISPKIPIQYFRKLRDDANNLLRGPCILIGDVNSRCTD